MVSGIICAAVRWFHMCAPYSENEEIYYPARKQMSFFFAMPILMLPYVLAPSCGAVMTYVSSVFMIYIPMSVCVLFRRYFRWYDAGNVKGWNTIYVISMVWMILSMAAVFLFPDSIVKYKTLYRAVSAAAGLVLDVLSLTVCLRLEHDMELFNTDSCSNPEDFPYRFARTVLFLPLVAIFATWILFASENHWVKLVLDLSFSVFYVWLLCHILHPQEGRSAGADVVRNAGLTEPEIGGGGEIEEEVLSIVARRFREPHLLKTEVLSEVKRGNIRKADQYIACQGYYRLVNMFRLEYARLYKEAHPDAIQDVVASEAGFTSRITYYKAKKSVGAVLPYVARLVKYPAD